MCSVSWRWDKTGSGREELLIVFNRDEQKARKPGLPPQVFEQGNRKILCPVDSEKGGTWLAANDAGLVAALLNNYHAEARPNYDPETSRGDLVKLIAGVSKSVEVHEILHKALSKKRYAPFTILVWQGGKAGMWNWSKEELSYSSNPAPLITTSSWETERVENWRREFYEEKVVREGWSLDRFHRYEVPGDEASSVCMTRPETRTVSLTSCRVTDSEVQMTYFSREENGQFGVGESACLPINILL